MYARRDGGHKGLMPPVIAPRPILVRLAGGGRAELGRLPFGPKTPRHEGPATNSLPNLFFSLSLWRPCTSPVILSMISRATFSRGRLTRRLATGSVHGPGQAHGARPRRS